MRQWSIIAYLVLMLLSASNSFAEDCGDVNNSGTLNILDVSYIINFLYKDGPSPICWKKPILSTVEVTEISPTAAMCGGIISSDGGSTITVRGVCWSTNAEPTLSDNKTMDGEGAGSFISSITGLTENAKYYVRAYAINSVDTGYGSTMVFTAKMAEVTDIDGNVYQTLVIGSQVWMAENLKVTHYQNGDPIPNIIDGSSWAGLTYGAYCEYNNDTLNFPIYGRLYNWYAATDGRNIAPAGWHVPSDAEWQTLIDYLGGDGTAGGKMKAAGIDHWNSPNTGATDESGFTALPSGYRAFDGSFGDIGNYATFWSGSGSDSWARYLGYNYSQINRYLEGKHDGYSIRCVKD